MTGLDDITRRPFLTPADEERAGIGLAILGLAFALVAIFALLGLVWSLTR